MDQVVSNIKSLVGSSKNGVSLINLSSEYKSLTGQKLNYQDYDFKNIQCLINEIDDLVIRRHDNEDRVFLRPSSNEENLNNLVSLINSTRQRSLRRKPSNLVISDDKPRGGCNKNTNNNNSMKPLQTTNGLNSGFSTSNYSSNFNSNYTYGSNLNNYIPATNFSNNSNYMYGFNYSQFPNYGGDLNSLDSQYTPLSTFNEADMIKYGCDLSKLHIRVNNPHPIKRVVNNDIVSSYMNDYQEFTKNRNNNNNSVSSSSNNCTTNKEDYGNSLLWAVHPSFNYIPNKSVVKVIGIQTGIALIKSATQNFVNNTIPAKHVSEFLAGDMFLWQPPVPKTTKESKETVDLNTSFVVIALTSPRVISVTIDISSDSGSDDAKESMQVNVRVKLHGLKHNIEVNMDDLYQLPQDKSELSRIFNFVQNRQVTAIPLLGVDEQVDMWPSTDSLSSITHAHFKGVPSNGSVNDEIFNSSLRYIGYQLVEDQCYLLENCDHRGNFLNIDVALYFLYEICPNFCYEKRVQVLKNILQMIEYYLSFLNKNYVELFNREVVPVNPKLRGINVDKAQNEPPIPLDLIYNEDDCDPTPSNQSYCSNPQSAILIGCRSIFKKNISKCPTSSDCSNIRLQRMQYSLEKKTFYYYDSPQFEVEDKIELASPIEGVFRINEAFTKCSNKLLKLEKARFQLAFIQAFPPYNQLKKILKVDC